LSAVSDEIADVTIYLVRLADVRGIPLVETANTKVDCNEERFPNRIQRPRIQ
jgi:NTP pyrophosphatase (non-canonical NTP hydrolase)